MMTMATKIMVEQWSFCAECAGRGCKECTRGAVVKLIPLGSLPRPIQFEYRKLQHRFISAQGAQEEVQEEAQDED